ncbi:MAG: tRNA (uridine(34)/cytosine(34)/5-carboxymethylaminomethyluridine(34)-2'-O)-methyltransferase TrmL [Gammaproteobacteria bacterium]|nr:tRNA (uridine(34)/cytosine(34)/5-carboxymethylaminomethyluridine(34)-2'-O)-methyltransferase TrmL [Gammaproteobacteria bacterium]
MFNIVLYQPEIPPNTGNIIRLCANTGCYLHLIRPLGFDLDDKRMRRAGLDYHEWADVRSYDNWDDFINKTAPTNLYTFSTKAKRYYTDVSYQEGDFLVFGPETRGLPQDIREARGMDHCLRLPMRQDSRSMNLSNAVSVIVYEGWRQLDFKNSF